MALQPSQNIWTLEVLFVNLSVPENKSLNKREEQFALRYVEFNHGDGIAEIQSIGNNKSITGEQLYDNIISRW